LIEAGQRTLRASGAGGAAARLLGGGGPEQAEAERAAAAWFGADDALLFPSGFQANLGLLSALADRRDGLVCDALLHASLIDAARLCRARVEIVPHGDLSAVDAALSRLAGVRRRFVLTEGVFSMDGDLADLAVLSRLAEQRDAWLLLDEAHSAGLLGPHGAGVWHALPRELRPRTVARLLTGGKALGVSGGLVVAAGPVIELLVNRARSFIFTTAPPPVVAGMLAAAIRMMPSLEAERQHCLALAQRLWGHLSELSRDLGQPAPARPAAAIVPWILGTEAAALTAAQRLQAAGFDVRAVRPPTVPVGSSRLRLVTHAHNSAAEVDALAEALGRSLRGNASPTRAAQSPPVVKEPRDALAPAAVELTAAAGAAPLTGRATQPGATRRTGAGAGLESAGCDAGSSNAADQAARQRPRPALIVLGTDTNIGKTVVSALALHVLVRRGPVGYWKPVQTGTDSDTDTVRGLLEPGRDVRLAEPLRHYALPASPDQAAEAESERVPIEALTPRLKALLAEDRSRQWVIELAGGLLVPYLDDWSQADWLQSLGSEVQLLLVARSGLGTLNHTQLTLEALRQRGLEPGALLLVGAEHRANRDYLTRTAGLRQILHLPILEPLSAASLAQVAASINPEGLCP
jgi:8-amino-7-oxononanoate synthase